MNPFSNLLGMFSNMASMANLYKQFSQNPMGALMSMGFNVPQHLQNNPQGMVNYLRNSGQMTEEQFNQITPLVQPFQNNMTKGF